MYNFIRPFIVLIIGVSTVCSQDSTNFFPYGDGDFIQYQYYDGYDYEILQATTILDSTDSAGNVYITRDFWFLNPLRKESPFDTERYKIDTLNHIYRIWEGLVVSVNLYYDLNADTNEIWINADIGSGSYGAPSKAWCFLWGESPYRVRLSPRTKHGTGSHLYRVLRRSR